jgi:hypothetical protein
VTELPITPEKILRGLQARVLEVERRANGAMPNAEPSPLTTA